MMAESVLSAVGSVVRAASGTAIRAGIVYQGFGQRFEFLVEGTNLTGPAVEELTGLVREGLERIPNTAITLALIYCGCALGKEIIKVVFSRFFGGDRDDQQRPNIEPGSLRVVLVCLTDERFLEILNMYQTGMMKDRLEEEFEKVGIKVEGLTITIINMKEVNQWKAEAIERKQIISKHVRNEGCREEINRRDKEIHEKNLCHFRISRCHECQDIKITQDELKANQDGVKANQDGIKARLNSIIEQEEELEKKQEETKMKINEIKQNLDEVKRTQAGMKEDQAAMKVEIKQQLETLTNTMKDFQLQISRVATLLLVKHEIIIAGGFSGPVLENTVETVETFSWPGGTWTYLSSMSQPRADASSCVYNNDVIVTGGYGGQDWLDTIEILKSNKKPLQWTLFNKKLPVKLSVHAVIVHQDKLIIIGGYNRKENKTSNVIYEMLLTPPYTTKTLTTMPEVRQHHAVELINNKLFILGGKTTVRCKHATDSVFVYDLTEKKFEPCATLPYAVFRMATVTWGNCIIVIGGANKEDEALNDVIKFDTVTRKSEKLPSMIYKRSGCSAVIIDDVIVVMGGQNEDQRVLNSVECLELGSYRWNELPRMKECRDYATAVVKPQN